MNDRSMATDFEAQAMLDDLVRAARADRPGSQSMQRAFVALGLGATTAAAATSAAAAVAGKSVGAGLTVLSIAKAAVLGIIAGGIALGTAAFTGMLSLGPQPETPAVAVSAGAAVDARAGRLAAKVAEPAAAETAAVEQDDESQVGATNAGRGGPAARQAASGPRAAPPVDDSESTGPLAASEKTLADEVRMLEAAKSELSAGRAGAAVDALDRYGRDFPNGRLALEADVLRIEALFKSGRAAKAIGLANKFLAANPNSPLANRVRAMLRDPPGAGAR